MNLNIFKNKVVLILGTIILLCLVFMSVLVFNLQARDAVRTPVLAMSKKVQAVFLGVHKTMPILAYHGVDADPSWSEKKYFVSPQEFENQVKFLKDNGYTALTMKQMDIFNTFEKPVALTFDDAYADLFQYAYPVLKKYNMRATIFVPTDLIGKKRYLTAEQIKSMTDVFDFESHTKSHNQLSKLSRERLVVELFQSKYEIEKITGKPVTTLAYPYSDFVKLDTNLISTYYKYALMNWGGKYYGFEEKCKIPRIPIYWNDSIVQFEKKLDT